MKPTSEANQPLPDPDPPLAPARPMLVPLEPPPARELPIQRGYFAKVLPNGMCMEVLYHGHLLSGVPRPDTGTLFAVVEFVRHAAGDSAAIEHAASEAPKPRDGACAHLLSSAPKAQCQNKNPEAGGPQGFGRMSPRNQRLLISLRVPADTRALVRRRFVVAGSGSLQSAARKPRTSSSV